PHPVANRIWILVWLHCWQTYKVGSSDTAPTFDIAAIAGPVYKPLLALDLSTVQQATHGAKLGYQSGTKCSLHGTSVAAAPRCHSAGIGAGWILGLAPGATAFASPHASGAAYGWCRGFPGTRRGTC